ncbi:hypothetical protein SteCoe_10502 [Stentor coeruleus]|uniref:Uncharacterized protein n=1 Tax=Stentor coeruleus TaxID=5963 RepID=A0A1R2CFL7_9CILI|nr:hypothetical protein SteCoe_10502 [Stentor coeruleus]
MDSNYIENWWSSRHKKYTIRDQRRPIFLKFHQIHGTYTIEQEDNIEWYKEEDDSRILYWEVKNKFKGERLEYIPSIDTFKYKGWFRIKAKKVSVDGPKKIDITEESENSPEVEKGIVIIKYEDYQKVIEWERNFGPKGSSESEFPVKTLKITSQRESKKGKVVFEEMTSITPTSFYKHGNFIRGSIEVEKTETRKGNEIIRNIEKKGEDLYKKTHIKKVGSQESGKIERRRRQEYLLSIWETNENAEYKEKIVEDVVNLAKPDLSGAKSIKKSIGKITYYERGANFYELSWIITDTYGFSRIQVSRNNHSFEKISRLNTEGTCELLDFKLGNFKWGVIKECSSSSSYNVQWIAKQPELYKEVDMKINMRSTALGKSNLVFETNKVIEDVREEVKFVYRELENLDVFEFKIFEQKLNNYFKPQILVAEGSKEALTEIIFNKLTENEEKSAELVDCQEKQHFEDIFCKAREENQVNMQPGQVNKELENLREFLGKLRRLAENGSF